MRDPLFDADDDANTPLAPAEREGLIPTYVTTRAELNEIITRYAYAMRWVELERAAALRELSTSS